MVKTLYFSLSFFIFLLPFSASVNAAVDDGVYSITCRQGAGYVALGAYHDVDPYICFVKDGSELSADAYWIVRSTSSGYTFRNEASGQWLVYTTGRVDAYYKYMTVSDAEPSDGSQYWHIDDNGDGTISIYSTVDAQYYWNLRYSQGLLGTYKRTSCTDNECFYLTAKEGQTPSGQPIEELTAFPEALHVYLKDGRIEAFPIEYVTGNRQQGGQIIIETSIGQTFTYAQTDVEMVSEQPPADFPQFESFKLNNKFNDQLFADVLGVIDEDTVWLSVAAIGKRLTPSFKLPDDQTLVYVGRERQESKVSRLRFDRDIYYVVTRPGITMLLPDANAGSDYSMQPYGRMVRVHVDWLTDRAEVPRIDIVTSDGQAITSKTEYKDATITIDGRGIFPSMATTYMQIRGRGNTSWNYSKKPYRLKFASKVKPLGMTKSKSWVLLANAQTGSLMSNAIGMKAASLIDAAAANHIVPVDLYINGQYKGNYNFTEKVGFANNSVDLADESAAAMFEFDTYYDEAEGQKFRSQFYNLPINIKEPDFTEGTTRLTLQNIQNDFNRFAGSLYQSGDITPHVDLYQLARFLMVNELICNFELYHPKSTFAYRESFESDTSKYVFGPVWDLDWGFGYEQNRSYFKSNTTSNYWIDNPSMEAVQFIRDLRFKTVGLSPIYAALWTDFMDNDLQELKEFCQDYYDFARNSLELNRTVWSDGTNYGQQATDAAAWLDKRARQIQADIAANRRPSVTGDNTPTGTTTYNVTYNYLYENRVVHSEIITCPSGAVLPEPTWKTSPLVEFKLPLERPAVVNRNISLICRLTRYILPGDVNNDGVVNTTDVNAIVNLLLRAASSSYPPAADANQDGRLSIADLITVLRIIGK